MSTSITFKRTYDAPIGKVWDALTRADALSEWLMPTNFEPIIGHEFEFRSKPAPGFDGIVHCKVLELVKNERLSFSWKAGSLDTVVTFSLKEANGKTILDFEQRGFEGLMNKLIAKNILSRGWKKKILTILLPQYLSK